jgi:hypothetical protein
MFAFSMTKPDKFTFVNLAPDKFTSSKTEFASEQFLNSLLSIR